MSMARVVKGECASNELCSATYTSGTTMMNAYRTLLVVILAAVSACALAQPVSPASRSAYKCKIDGKTVYSDEPCLGAQKIDVEPSKSNAATRSTSTGSSARRQQPRPEPQAEASAEGEHPTADIETKPAQVLSGRARLSSASQRECRDLESSMTALEREEKEASKSELPRVQSQLFTKRKRFADLGC
jgi:hypothetical protein